jgi:hypothetical protein
MLVVVMDGTAGSDFGCVNDCAFFVCRIGSAESVPSADRSLNCVCDKHSPEVSDSILCCESQLERLEDVYCGCVECLADRFLRI